MYSVYNFLEIYFIKNNQIWKFYSTFVPNDLPPSTLLRQGPKVRHSNMEESGLYFIRGGSIYILNSLVNITVHLDPRMLFDVTQKFILLKKSIHTKKLCQCWSFEEIWVSWNCNFWFFVFEKCDVYRIYITTAFYFWCAIARCPAMNNF